MCQHKKLDQNELLILVRDVSGFVRLFLILTKNRFLTDFYDKFMKNAILLAKNQEYVYQKCEKSYFSTKYRISAQNRIRPSERKFH